MAINSIAIKQIIGAWAFDSSDKIKWMCSQVGNFQISQNSESTAKTDSNGSTIFTIDRNKSCQITFDSSVLDLSLIAALNGTERVDATNDKKIRVPNIERKALTATDITNKYITLSETPVSTTGGSYPISFHTLTTDKSLLDNYDQVSGAATTNKFYFDSSTKRLYFPTSLTAGAEVEVIYEYEVSEGVKITNAADKFPDAAKVRFLVVAVDLCDATKARALWVTANSAKPATSNTIGFNLEDTISVTLELAQSYCGDKSFYEIAVADRDFNYEW